MYHPNPKPKIQEYNSILFNKVKSFCFCAIDLSRDIEVTYEKDYERIHAYHFYRCRLSKFPDDSILLDLAQNLKSIKIIDCGLTKIQAYDLCGFKKLRELYMDYNLIEELPKGLFELTPQLEVISFRENRISQIDYEILNPIHNLMSFNLMKNTGYNVWYDAINGHGNVSLLQLKAEIVMLDKNLKMESEIDQLNAEVFSLKRKVSSLTSDCEKYKTSIQQLKLRQTSSDFTIKVNRKEFKVNKEILIDSSPVLAKMIQGKGDAEQLELFDISEKTVETILKFIYIKILPDDYTDSTELFAACARLGLKELMDITARMLLKKITPDNALSILNLGAKYKHEGLRKKAFDEYKKTFN